MSQINKKIDQELAKLNTDPNLDYRYQPDADSVDTEISIKDLFSDSDFLTLGLDGSDTIFLQGSSTTGPYQYTSGTAGLGGLGKTNYNYSKTPLFSTGTSTWTSLNPTVNITSNGIELPEDGDILIGNRSLKNMIETIEQRLSILVPDPKKLEHYEALKQAYEHYRTLEALCIEPNTRDSI